MTLERIGANSLLYTKVDGLRGPVLDLGAGEDPYRSRLPQDTISMDIDPTWKPAVVGDAHALPFGDAKFNGVVASQVFEHLHDGRLAASELARVLRPGGRLVLAVPFLYWLHQEPHDYVRYTRHGLQRLLGNEFEDIDITGYGGRLAAAWDILTTATATSTIPRRGVRALRKQIFGSGITTTNEMITRFLVRRAGIHPLGYVVTARRP